MQIEEMCTVLPERSIEIYLEMLLDLNEALFRVALV